jgi:NitT/TauT family transport system substrate-binding protein
LITKVSAFNERRSGFIALARAWSEAVAYANAHLDEATQIMARNVGGWLEDPAVFAETLKGVRLYDAERNRAYFGTPDRPGQIYETAQYGIEVWSSLGVLGAPLSPADVIRHGIWNE